MINPAASSNIHTPNNLERYAINNKGLDKQNSKTNTNRATPVSHSNAFPNMGDLSTQFGQLVIDLAQGRATASEIEAHVRLRFQATLNWNKTNGRRITGDCPEANKQVILESFASMVAGTTCTLFHAHQREGQRIARQNGFLKDGFGLEWVHYNSDFYFAEQEIHAIIAKVAQELLSKEGFDNVDLDAYYATAHNSRVSFNEMWSIFSQRGLNLPGQTWQLNAHMINIQGSPPRGFNLFMGESIDPVMIPIIKGRAYQSTDIMIHRQIMIVNGQTIKMTGEIGEDRPNLLDFVSDGDIRDIAAQDFLANFRVFRGFHVALESFGRFEDRLFKAYFND